MMTTVEGGGLHTSKTILGVSTDIRNSSLRLLPSIPTRYFAHILLFAGSTFHTRSGWAIHATAPSALEHFNNNQTMELNFSPRSHTCQRPLRIWGTGLQRGEIHNLFVTKQLLAGNGHAGKKLFRGRP